MIKFDRKLLEKKLGRAKESGALDLSGLDLHDLPEEVCGFENVTIEGKNWWKVCPLSRLSFSNNNIR